MGRFWGLVEGFFNTSSFLDWILLVKGDGNGVGGLGTSDLWIVLV